MARILEIIRNNKEKTKWVIAAVMLAGCFLGCWKRQTTRPVIFEQTQKPDDFNVRVLLFDNIKEFELASTAGFSVRDTSMNLKAHFNSTDHVKVKLDGEVLKVGDYQYNDQIEIVPDKFSVLEINSKMYRGDINILKSGDNSISLINRLDIEEYLAGVVGAEMPSYWEIEALKAQTMAARTYCLFIKNKFGVNRSWDVKATQANQVYGGVAAETTRVRQAVFQTKGLVLVCKHRDGQTKIFPTYYSSTCGGHTENSYNVFGDYYGPLTGVDCDHCLKTAKKQYLNWPPFEIDETQANKKLMQSYSKLQSHEKIENIEEAKITSYGVPGRFTSVKLTGKDGKKSYLRGEDLRLCLDPSGTRLKSTYCRIMKTGDKYRFYDGKGFGHGVGMCQYGAQTLARNGKGYKEILAYYYPGSQMKRLY